MKKLYLLCAVALGFAFTACDDYEEPNPPAQKNDPVTVYEADGVELAQTTEAASLIDLNNVTEVALADVTLKEGFPANADLEAVLEIALKPANEGDPQFVKVGTCPLTVKDGKLIAEAEGLEGAVIEAAGKRPVKREFDARYAVYAVAGGEKGDKAQLGDPEKDYYYGPFELTIMPKTFANVIEEAYYFVWGDGTTWNKTDAEKFNHSTIDVYDDPVFSVKFDVTDQQAANGFHWMVVPESVYNNGDFTKGYFGVGGDATAMKGELALNATAGEIAGASAYLITINMESLSYNIGYAFPYLYVRGKGQVLETENFSWYSGFAPLTKDLYFNTEVSATKGVIFFPVDDENIQSAKQPKKYKIETPGLYWIEVDVVAMTWKHVLCSSWGIVGVLNNWGNDGDPDVALTPSDDFLTWTAKDVEIKAGEAFKFRANGEWDVDLGGDPTDLKYKGGDMTLTEDGKYDVVLSFAQTPYSATFTKK